MIHENLIVQICPIVAVHGESARLREGVNNSGMSVEVAAPLHAAVAESTRGFERVAVEDDLVDGSVVVMESGERSDGTIYHWAVEPGGGLAGNAVAKSLHLCFHFARGFLEGLLQAAVLEADKTAGVFLKFLLAL